MKINQPQPYRLVTDDSPAGAYIAGLLIFALGAVLSVVIWEQPGIGPVRIIPLALGLLFAVIGLIVILFAAKRITCTFDKSAGTLTVSRKRLLGAAQMRSYPLSALTRLDIEVSQTRSSRNGGGPTYRVRCIMGSGDNFTLSSVSIGDRRRVEQDIFAIDSFLRGG